jgi:hypothetical protein
VAVRVFNYIDREQYLADLQQVAQVETAGAIAGDILLVNGAWNCVMTVTTWLSGSTIDSPAWLGTIHGTPAADPVIKSYSDYANRSTASYLQAVASGAILVPHVYMGFFMPASETRGMVDYLTDTPDAALGAKQLVCMPIITKNFKQSLLPMPRQSTAFHMRIYRKAAQEGSPQHLQMLQLNHDTVLPKILAAGGTLYLPFTPLLTEDQRVQNFGTALYAEFKKAKSHYDPKGILTPGAGLF